jgi:arsenate reductase (glutaredoxin)
MLQDKGIEPEVLLYVEEPPSAVRLKELGELMGKGPLEFMRKGEQEFKDHVKGRELSDDQLYALMAKHPILMERPIVVRDAPPSSLDAPRPSYKADSKAVLGRPPEAVLGLF